MTGYNSKQRGFALLIAVVLSAVAALVTVSLTTLAYKSLLLSSDARMSQYAFYAADTGLECALYYDSYNGTPAHLFTFMSNPTSGTVGPVNCDGTQVSFQWTYDATNHRDVFTSGWFTVNPTSLGGACVNLTIYKGDPNLSLGSQLFSDATNVSCATRTTDPRAVERGEKATY